MAVAWTEELAIGVEQIDEQHKEIFRRVNALLEACKSGKGKEAVGETVKFLENYVVEHFAAEENIQLHYSYPDYKLHKAMHEAFIADVQGLKKMLDEQGATLTAVLRTNQLVVDWLVKHIKKADKDLGEHVRRQPR